MRALALLGLALAHAASARADSGAILGESSRAAALAGAVTARPGDTSAIYANPAALDAIDRPTLVVLGHVGEHRQSFARYGELGRSERQGIGGWGIALVSPLPGPAWLRRVRLGGALLVPGAEVLRVNASNRSDDPTVFYYGERTQRTAMSFSLGVALPFRTSIGVGVAVYSTLVAPTRAGFDPNRGEDVDEGVFIEQDRIVTMDASAIIGVRVQPIDELAFGLTWHQGGASRASGEIEIRAGPIVVEDTYSFYQMIAPMDVTFGTAVFPTPELDLSVDLTWARWSEFRTILDEVPDPPFSDTFSVRAGAEYRPHPFLAVRAGYGFVPSPVPEQIARDNFLDGHRHVMGLGLGFDFEALQRAPWSVHYLPFRFDVTLRFHAQQEQRADKDRAALRDADPMRIGTQIDNLGYPGFRARGSFMQVSFTLTVPLGPALGVGIDE